MEPPSYMKSVVDRNVVMRRVPAMLAESATTILMHSSLAVIHSTNASMSIYPRFLEWESQEEFNICVRRRMSTSGF